MNAGSISWSIARFGEARLDRNTRELTRSGRLQPITQLAFSVLVQLIDQRRRVVSKDELIASCWGGEAGSDGALASTIMKIRRCIGELDAAPWIRTVRGVGYCFDGHVDLADDGAIDPSPLLASAAEVSPSAPRVVILPLVNGTCDPGMAWTELGLMSMIERALGSLSAVSVVPVHEVLVALAGVAYDAPLEVRLAAVQRHLDPDVLVSGRLSGRADLLMLQLELRRRDAPPRLCSVSGTDAAQLAVDIARQVAGWLSPEASAEPMALLDLGDPFLNESFARAMQRSGEARFLEAAHLLDVVADCGVDHQEVQLERAKVHVALGVPRAAEEVEALRQAAASTGNDAQAASVGLLAGTLAGQQGDMARAGALTVGAAEVAARAGRIDLSVQCLIEAARHLGQCFDPRAPALLSRAIPMAERLGNQVLLRDAYSTAGSLAGLRDDWIGALRYHEASLAISNGLSDATRSASLASIGWALGQLGRVEESCDFGLEGFRCALISGALPALGDAAMTAVLGCMAAQRVLAVIDLFHRMQALAPDQTMTLVVARDLLCRASILRLLGRFDEAETAIASTRRACRGHLVFESYCDISSVRLLLNAHRFDDMLAMCDRLRRSEGFAKDSRLRPWIERHEAFADHLAFGRTDDAISRLHACVASLPLSEIQGRSALDLAWLHLERGDSASAQSLLADLQFWLEQSAQGMLVMARLNHEQGRFDEAVIEQCRYASRFPNTTTPFIESLLDIYKVAQRTGRRQTIETLDVPLNFEWGLSDSVKERLPPELGGFATRC